MLESIDVNGNPYIGLYTAVNDTYALIGPGLPVAVPRALRRCLGVETLGLTLDGSRLIGALAAMNNRGVVVTGHASPDELRILRGKMEVGLLPGKLTAAGNTILVNDRAACVHPGFDKASIKLIGETLGVEVLPGTIAGTRTIGSSAVAAKDGVLCHPKASAPEREALAKLFGVDVLVGTANFGSPMIGAAVVANRHGALVGQPTTGIEMGRVEEALGRSWDPERSS